jgi:hypothetical protein
VDKESIYICYVGDDLPFMVRYVRKDGSSSTIGRFSEVKEAEEKALRFYNGIKSMEAANKRLKGLFNDYT